MRLERTILNNLVFNEDFLRATIPFLKEEYFHNAAEKAVFEKIQAFVIDHNTCPSKDVLHIEFEGDTTLNDTTYKECYEIIKELHKDDINKNWLLKETENFCQEKAVYNGVIEAINIIDGTEKNQDKGSIPDILSKALAVSFDSHVGHDYVSDAALRYDYYHEEEERIPFDIDMLNKITKGGLPRKTLNIILAGTGIGKTLAMCHMAAANALQGKNVLYITLEMSEMRIPERIDANLLNIPINDLIKIDRKTYLAKMEELGYKINGRLIIKEYPTASAGVGHFRHLLNELELKTDFVPDIVYVDYLNICISSRYKFGANMNSYSYIKAIAEELRGLAVERNIPIVSATQTNRDGYGNSDVDLTDTSESFGLPMTTDFMIALIGSEDLDSLGQLMVKQLKNRYNDLNYYRRFNIGVDRSYMRMYNLADDFATDVIETNPVESNLVEPHSANSNRFDSLKLLID